MALRFRQNDVVRSTEALPLGQTSPVASGGRGLVAVIQIQKERLMQSLNSVEEKSSNTEAV